MFSLHVKLGFVCLLYMQALRIQLLFVLFYLPIVCPCVSGQKYSQFPPEFCVTGLRPLTPDGDYKLPHPRFFHQALYPFIGAATAVVHSNVHQNETTGIMIESLHGLPSPPSPLYATQLPKYQYHYLWEDRKKLNPFRFQ